MAVGSSRLDLLKAEQIRVHSLATLCRTDQTPAALRDQLDASCVQG